MNEKLNIQDLACLFAEKQGMDKKRAETFIKEFFLLIEEGLEKDKYVKVRGLGTFKLIEVESRESVDVNTGERIEIKGHTKVSFTPEPVLKEIINRPFSHFESVVLNDNVAFDDLQNENEEDDEGAVPTVVVSEAKKTQDEVCEPVVAEVENVVIVPQLGKDSELDSELDSEPESKPELDADMVSGSDTQTEIESKAEKETEKETEKEAESEVESETKAVTETETPADVDVDVDTALGEDAGKRPLAFYFQYFLIAIMFLCFGCVLAIYWEDLCLLFKTNDSNKEQVAVEVTEKDSLLKLQHDTLVSVSDEIVFPEEQMISGVGSSEVKSQSKDASQPIEHPQEQNTDVFQKKEKKALKAKPFTPDSTGYDIIGTEASYTIKEGETLTRVALKFYGTKALWPYIVKHNASVIVNPDNVPFGTTIKIPKLKKKQ